MIVYVWFYDEDTLRKAGAKTDVYETFKRMLARGVVPTDIAALLTQADPDSHFEFPDLWPAKFLQAGRANYQSFDVSRAMRAAASLSR